MEYNVFLIHARNDEKFVQNLARTFSTHRLSVRYGSPLEQQDSLIEAINEGFASATYGIILLSPVFMSLQITLEEKQYLSEVINQEHQCLLQIWLNIEVDEIARFNDRLVERPALFCPPETAESIARKFVVKVAGDPRLQSSVLDQGHDLMRYKAPWVGCFTADNQRRKGLSKILSNQDVQTYLSRLLDVNLRGLANWKELSKEIGLKDADIKSMIQADSPTICLLNYIRNIELTLSELENACLKINRSDIKVYLQKLY